MEVLNIFGVKVQILEVLFQYFEVAWFLA
jgi:hypothetical protein